MKIKKVVKFIVGIFVLGCVSISGFFPSLSSSQIASAQGIDEQRVKEIVDEKIKESQSTEQVAINFVNELNSLLKFLYTILRPLLFLAGLAVDNSLVYGEIFHFDAILIQIWNIMRDFANFSLFFIALYFIFKEMRKQNTAGIQKVIKQMLIAGILIQASWFLMSAIIDLSTIAIVAIGGLPGQVQDTTNGEHTKNIMKTPILQNNILGKRSSGDNDAGGIFYYYSYGKKNIPQCRTATYDGRMYILGMDSFPPDNHPLDFEANVCAYGKDVYRVQDIDDGIFNIIGVSQDSVNINTLSGYNEALKQANTYAGLSGLVASISEHNYLVPFFLLSGEVYNDCSGNLCGKIPDTDRFFTDEGNAYTLEKLLKNMKGQVGTFVTLYSSVMGYADMAIQDGLPSGANIGTVSMFLMKGVFAILLIIPLIAMIVVLVLRLGILWLAIIFAPFLIIKWVFFDGDSKVGGEWMNKHFTKGNLISIIFAPVIMVFAIGISLIFMQAIDANMTDKINRSKVMEEQFNITMEDKDECKGGYLNVMGLFSICDKGQNIAWMGNSFLFVIERIFALALMRFLLFAAIKTNSIGKEIGQAIQSTAEKWMGTMPIIPMGKGGGIGLNAFKSEVLSGKAVDRVVSKKNMQDQQKLYQAFPGVFGDAKQQSLGNLETGAVRAYHSGNLQNFFDTHRSELAANHIFTHADLESHIEGLLTSDDTKSKYASKGANFDDPTLKKYIIQQIGDKKTPDDLWSDLHLQEAIAKNSTINDQKDLVREIEKIIGIGTDELSDETATRKKYTSITQDITAKEKEIKDTKEKDPKADTSSLESEVAKLKAQQAYIKSFAENQGRSV